MQRALQVIEDHHLEDEPNSTSIFNNYGTVKLIENEPEIKGFSDKNIWRMKQFYQTYKDFPKLSTLLREISWSHNLSMKE